jgi:diguanylate cyclase (GGDEF)-like protein
MWARRLAPESDGAADTPEALRIRELERKLADLRVLQDFSSTLLEHRREIDDILWDVARLAVARFNLEDCVIYLLDPDRGDLVQRAAYGPKNPRDREILNPIRLAVGRGIVGSVAATGRIERIIDTRQDPRYVQDDEARLSELAVPILQQGRVIGVIDSEHSALGFFTEWHRDLFVSIAAMTGARIMAAQLERQRLDLATRDTLTGLANRSEVFRSLQARLDRAPGTVAVVFVDLDHFGVINDSLSHLAGDEVLRTVGERIRTAMPADGVAARFGGDEFVIVFEADHATAREASERIATSIRETLHGGLVEGLRVDCSVGLALGLNGLSAADVIHQSDLAMYHAKRSGRGRVQVHDSVIAGARRREQQLVVDMVRSLERGGHEIGVHMQPIHSVVDRGMVGAEVLARWRHPDLGAVPPVEFILAAERTGNIRPLGRHLFRSAFGNIGAWTDAVSGLVFNVNVSPLQLQHEGFATDLLGLLAEAGVAPSRVACEVTESALLGDESRVARVLAQLVEAGVSMVLDDFGTGFASLSTLRRHPFSGIKIDRQFVRGVVTDPVSRAIVRGVVSLSSDLGLACTAEGVEQPDQLRILEELGCPLMQGRWICDAIPPADFLNRVRNTVQRG